MYLQNGNKRVETTDSKSLAPQFYCIKKTHTHPISLGFENFTPHSKHRPYPAINNEQLLLKQLASFANALQSRAKLVAGDWF